MSSVASGGDSLPAEPIEDTDAHIDLWRCGVCGICHCSEEAARGCTHSSDPPLRAGSDDDGGESSGDEGGSTTVDLSSSWPSKPNRADAENGAEEPSADGSLPEGKECIRPIIEKLRSDYPSSSDGDLDGVWSEASAGVYP
ncbi:hypothetical protein ACFQL7_21010 [Halocatena marina]|uniref:Uncharacterized protein n=1 Tax=Halocatena marina TaxID=2934937 RepID=A0ABD5YRT6_9EURY